MRHPAQTSGLRSAGRKSGRTMNPPHINGERLWWIVNQEELTGKPVDWQTHDRAMEKLLRLESAHHELTRRANCDCKDCREHGWYVPRPRLRPSASHCGNFWRWNSGHRFYFRAIGGNGEHSCFRSHMALQPTQEKVRAEDRSPAPTHFHLYPFHP